MNPLRSILLHVDASPRSAERARLAQAVADRAGAALDALYAVTPALMSQPFALVEGAAATLQMLQDLDDEQRRQAEARLRAAGGTPLPSWSTTGMEPAVRGFVARALFADLLVLGQHEGDEDRDAMPAGTPSDFVASVLLGSGKPVLVVPRLGRHPTVGRCVLLAWKPTREAAHALSAALPLMRHTQALHVVGAEGEDQDRLARCLQRQGVKAPLHHHAPLFEPAGEALLSLAADVQADLLVMGGYGHSRARELVLGGVTRTLLASMTLPVLMAH